MYQEYTAAEYRQRLRFDPDYTVDALVIHGANRKRWQAPLLQEVLDELGIQGEYATMGKRIAY